MMQIQRNQLSRKPSKTRCDNVVQNKHEAEEFSCNNPVKCITRYSIPREGSHLLLGARLAIISLGSRPRLTHTSWIRLGARYEFPHTLYTEGGDSFEAQLINLVIKSILSFDSHVTYKPFADS